jgi:hypothetical protein
MRRSLALGILLTLAGCSNSTGTTSFTALGTWRSEPDADTRIEMTLVESARATTGAGYWRDADGSRAFQVTGAHAEDRVSLFFEFDVIPNVDFQGRFDTRTIEGKKRVLMSGRLYGGPFDGDSVDFVRLTDDE